MRFRMFLCDGDGGEGGDDDEHWFKITRSTDPPVFSLGHDLPGGSPH